MSLVRGIEVLKQQAVPAKKTARDPGCRNGTIYITPNLHNQNGAELTCHCNVNPYCFFVPSFFPPILKLYQ